MPNKQGKFIVIEGLEGAGKSTVIDHCKNLLMKKGLTVMSVREPGGTIIGDEVRAWIKEKNENLSLDIRTELLLFYASRIQLVESVIKPALAKGIWVLADRFEWSTFAYQGGGRELDKEFIKQLSQFSLKGFKADWTIFLDVSVEKSFIRTSTRGALDRMEEESLEFFSRVYDEYQSLLKTEGSSVFIVAAEEPLLDVSKSISKIIDTII